MSDAAFQATVADGRAEDAARVVTLAPALWQRLEQPEGLADYAAAWLALQAAMLGDCRRGLVVGYAASGLPDGQALAAWPGDGAPSSGPADLGATTELAAAERRGVLRRVPATPGVEPCTQLALPLLVDGQLLGVAGFEVAGQDQGQLRERMRRLQWGAGGLRERLGASARAMVERSERRARTILDLVAAALEEEGFAAACRLAVTELALRTGAERVAVGFSRGGQVTLAAISHTAQFGQRMTLVRRLGQAMDEALDQRAVIVHPPRPGEALVVRAHGELAQATGLPAIPTTPILLKDRFVGAFTLERAAERPFEADEVALVEGAASALGAVLDDKRLGDRWLVEMAADAAVGHARRLFGPRHLGRKAALLALGGLVLAGYYARGPYRIAADAVVEGEVRRVVVAALDGFIKEAGARAGDVVRAGDPLARLDDGDLQLERLGYATDRQKRLHEYNKALGERDRSAANIARAQIDQAEAQMALLDEQLARTRLVAPFDGLVVAGDLSQAIGGAVERGQVLFELAPLNSYRVTLQVDESQIGEVAVGRTGHLLTTSLPDTPLAFTVSRLTPVAQAHEGRNTFAVEGSLAEAVAGIRPGMKRVAKIDVERRRLVWIWTRSLRDWAKIAAWRWLG